MLSWADCGSLCVGPTPLPGDTGQTFSDWKLSFHAELPRQRLGILCHILDYRKNKEILSKNFLENYQNEIMSEFITYIWKDSIWTQKFVNIFTFLFVPPSTSIFLVISNQLWLAFMLIMNTIMLSCWQIGLFFIFYVGDAQLWCNSDDWLSGLS